MKGCLSWSPRLSAVCICSRISRRAGDAISANKGGSWYHCQNLQARWATNVFCSIASNVLSTKWWFSKRTWFPTKQWTQRHSSTVCLREKQQFYVLWSSSCKYGIKVRTTHTQNEIWNWIFRCSKARYLKDMSRKVFRPKLRHLLMWRLKIWKCWTIQLDKNDSRKNIPSCQVFSRHLKHIDES